MKRVSLTTFAREREGTFLLLIFVAAVAVLVLRRPDAVFGARFWAEDGAYWYADAYRLGLGRTLIETSVGYFQTLARLAAGAALAVPLRAAPLVMNVSALAVQAIPAVMLVSRRFSGPVPDLRMRLLLAGMYLALPNSGETHANITNAQWYLALAALLVHLGGVSRDIRTKACDAALTALSALSGPFILFIAPVAVFRWRRERVSWRRALAAIALAGMAIQGAAIFLLDKADRVSELPRMSAGMLAAIAEKQIVIGGLMGPDAYDALLGWGAAGRLAAHAALAAAIALVAYALVRSRDELRLFVLVAAALFFAGMVSPTVGGEDRVLDPVGNSWTLLLAASGGIRYWIFPVIAFQASLVWGLARTNPRIVRAVSAAFLAMLAVGVVLDFRDPPSADHGFVARAAEFESAAPGTRADFPLDPPPWSMTLMKR